MIFRAFFDNNLSIEFDLHSASKAESAEAGLRQAQDFLNDVRGGNEVIHDEHGQVWLLTLDTNIIAIRTEDK